MWRSYVSVAYQQWEVAQLAAKAKVFGLWTFRIQTPTNQHSNKVENHLVRSRPFFN